MMADATDVESVSATGLSVNAAWDLQEAEDRPDNLHRETFRKRLRESMVKMLEEFGGPENYLRVRFPDQKSLTEWLNHLVALVSLDAHKFDF